MDKAERIIIKAPGAKIVAIGDAHFPFADKKKLRQVLEIIGDIKPSIVVQVGDLYDLYTFSRFVHSVDYITPKEELLRGKKAAQEMWEQIRRLTTGWFFQLRGNHTHRIVKDIMAKAPEFEALLSEPINKLTEFPGVKDTKSSRSELVINDIMFVHGWGTKPGSHMNYFGQSVVCGHSHKGGVLFKAQKGKSLFELNCGHIADPDAVPLQYGETKTANWVSGCGLIDKYGPRFVPL